MKKPKLIYILPRYDTATGTHLFYLYSFIQRLSVTYDLWLVVLAGDDPRGEIPGLFRTSYIGGMPRVVQVVLLKLALLRARLLGFKNVYVHYSYWAALLASFVMRPLGGRVRYWNCGMPWLFGSQYPLRITLFFVSTLVTGTPAMKEMYSKQYGVPRSKISVMPNWIEPDRFLHLPSRDEARATLGFDRDAPTVLYVHTLSPRKGADRLPAILRGLPENVRMVIVGGGELKEELINTMREYDDRVHFTGWVPARDIPLYMRAADVYVMPSREEGFPHTILESMAAGTPFVATNVGGMQDIVPAEYVETLLVTSVFDMAKKISVLLNDSSIYSKTSSALGEHVLRYSIDRVVSDFTKMI